MYIYIYIYIYIYWSEIDTPARESGSLSFLCTFGTESSHFCFKFPTLHVLHIRALKEYLNFCNKTHKCTYRKCFVTHYSLPTCFDPFCCLLRQFHFQYLLLEPETKKRYHDIEISKCNKKHIYVLIFCLILFYLSVYCIPSILVKLP